MEQLEHPNAHGAGNVPDVPDVPDEVQGEPRARASDNGHGVVADRNGERGSPPRLAYLRSRREQHGAELAAGAATLADVGEGEWLAAFPGVAFEPERDVKGAEAAKLLGIHPATLDAMCRRGEIVPRTDAGPGKRWYPMSELRRIKPDVGAPAAVEVLTKRARDLAEHYREIWPCLDREATP